jgi:Family of unknown function (DUF6261)
MIIAIDLKGLRNAEYVQFTNDISELVTQNNPQTLGVETQHQEFKGKITETENLFKIQQSSEVTEEIQGLDLRRDNAITGMSILVTGYLSHFDSIKSKAAHTLNENLKVYGAGIARENLQAETAIINSIIGDWEKKPVLEQALIALNITDWKEELKVANTLFNEKYIARTKEYGNANPDNMLKKREETNFAYYELRKHIDAHGIINNQPAPYVKVVNEINALIEQYNTLLNTRLATAKRNNTNGNTTPATE